MPLWRFLDYCPVENGSCIRDWYDVQEPNVKAAFDVTVELLSIQRKWVAELGDPEIGSFKVLNREHAGLSEIRFEVDRPKKRHFRPLGIWMEGTYIFIFLNAYEKSGRCTIPPNALKRALELKALWEEGKGTICDHL